MRIPLYLELTFIYHNYRTILLNEQPLSACNISLFPVKCRQDNADERAQAITFTLLTLVNL